MHIRNLKVSKPIIYNAKKDKDASVSVPLFSGPEVQDETKLHTAGKQALKDWIRNLNSDVYLIDGKSFKTILKELINTNSDKLDKWFSKPKLGEKFDTTKTVASFNSIESLREFFKEYLLYKVKDEGLKDHLSWLALNHFHQSGLPHCAGNFLYRESMSLLSKSNISVRGHELLTNFSALENGIRIEEESKNVQLIKQDPVTGDLEVEEQESGYYAKTESASSLTCKKENGKFIENISVDHLTVDVTDERLTDLYDIYLTPGQLQDKRIRTELSKLRDECMDYHTRFMKKAADMSTDNETLLKQPTKIKELADSKALLTGFTTIINKIEKTLKNPTLLNASHEAWAEDLKGTIDHVNGLLKNLLTPEPEGLTLIKKIRQFTHKTVEMFSKLPKKIMLFAQNKKEEPKSNQASGPSSPTPRNHRNN